MQNYLYKVLMIILVFLLPDSGSSEAMKNENVEEKIVRIMTVVICQQDEFLQYLLEPYLSGKNLKIEYRQGHHSEVAKAVKNREVDLVITHAKVKSLQKMESDGLLKKGHLLFANPMVFLGPKGDPANIKGLDDPVQAVRNIQGKKYCFVINNHDRLAQIQKKLLEKTNITDSCVIENVEEGGLSAVDIAIEKNAYTLWGLHPYARKAQNKLEPVVIPHRMLLESMTGWAVSNSGVEIAAEEILNYLSGKEVKKLIRDFRLKNYPDIQAWWPAE